MSPDLYYYYHTKVVFDFLSPYEENKDYPEKDLRKYSSRRHKVNGVLKCPETSYKLLPSETFSPDFIKELQKRGYPCVALYLGGMEACVREMRDVIDISAPLDAKASSTAVRGSDSSCTSFLSKNYGYSGATTENTKTFTRAVSMMGGVLDVLPKDMPVDLEIFSPGDVPLIYSSLMRHYEQDDRWRLILTRHQYANVEKKYKNRVSVEARKGSHFVSYKPVMMQSYGKAKDQGEKENNEVTRRNYMRDSHKWRPVESYSGYTIYTKLYGYYPWAKPKTKDDAPSTGRGLAVDELMSPSQPHYVYGFGFSDDFLGIVSTIQEYKLLGFRATLINEKNSRRVELKKEMVSLKLYATELEFYRTVCAHNAIRESYFCYARPLYSPISNVLHVEKGGVPIQYSDNFDEWSVIPQDTGIERPEEVLVQDFDKTSSFPPLLLTIEERDMEDVMNQEVRSKKEVETREISNTLGRESTVRTIDRSYQEEQNAVKTYPLKSGKRSEDTDLTSQTAFPDGEDDEDSAMATGQQMKNYVNF